MGGKTAYYTATDIMRMTGLNRQVAFSLIACLNHDLEKKGFYPIADRVPRPFFNEAAGTRFDETNTTGGA